MKFYVIRLSAEERDELTSLVETGREAAYRRRNARILLLADQGEHGPGQPDTQVGVTRQTVRCVAVCRTAWRLRWYAASGAASGLRCWMARERHIACSDPPAGLALPHAPTHSVPTWRRRSRTSPADYQTLDGTPRRLLPLMRPRSGSRC